MEEVEGQRGEEEPVTVLLCPFWGYCIAVCLLLLRLLSSAAVKSSVAMMLSSCKENY